jgi:hypothetical protein
LSISTRILCLSCGREPEGCLCSRRCLVRTSPWRGFSRSLIQPDFQAERSSSPKLVNRQKLRDPTYTKKQDYTVEQIDLFAAYIIPADVWYLIPSAVLLGPQRKVGLMLFPMVPLRKDRYKYEAYKEAWTILSKSKRALAAKYPRI